MDGKTCQPIKVFARLRPLKQNKKVLTQSVTHKDVSLSLNENFLLVDHKDQYLKVKFDKVFGENETQLDVFSHVQDMADDLINGTSCGILAYGQTGSGKTYSMFGRAQTLKQLALSKTISEDSGLCSRLLKEVFDKKPATSKVTFSMFQIYNENVYDVLQRDDVPLQVLEDSGHQSCVQGLASFEISTVEDAFYLLAKGDSKRYVRETEFNAQSSRSHTIAVLEYAQTSVEGITKVRSAITQESRMILCDLAGSERMTELINPKEKRFVEMKYINLSLTALGKVIYTMSSNPSMLPPFRDSALTRILKSIFLQNGKAIILVNINPASDCTDESMNTIRFAKYARHVKTMTVRKENYRPGSPEAKSSSHFKEEILNLKQKLALQTRLKSPLRVFSKDKLHLDVRSNREREQQQWQIEGEQMKRIMKENDKLKEEIQRLVQKQVHSMGGRSHAGKNDEIDSTNSGLEDLGLYL